MFNILTLNKIAKCGLDQLNDNYKITDDANVDADGIILRSFKMHDMELPESLKAVARAGAGTNNIPIDKCSEKGIVVFNTPGANANAVKELVIAGMLLASRDVIGGVAWANTLTGDDVDKQVEKGKSNFAGCEIKGKTLGIIGLGAIGILVANAAVALGMNVIGFDPFMSVGNALKLAPTVKLLKSAEDVMVNCDYLTIHVPLTDDTRDMVDADMIAKMKDGVILINNSRGQLVVEQDLADALNSGKVYAAGLDVVSTEPIKGDNPLLTAKNCIITPHISWAAQASRQRIMDITVDNIKAFLEGNTVNQVNK